MAVVNKDTIKSYFQTGDKPSQSNYTDLIDSLAFTGDMSQYGTTIQSDTNENLVFRGPTSSSSDTSKWISIVGAIPNFNSDLAGSSVATDGEYIYSIGTGTGGPNAAILKVDLMGNTIWTKAITEDSYGECIIYKNGYFWLFYTDVGNTGNISIIQMDSDGNIVNNWDFTTASNTANGYDIDVDEDNNVYFTGTEFNSVSGQNEMVIGKLNTNTSNIDWSYNMGNSSIGFVGYYIEYFNGNLYIATSINDGSLVINKTDSDGNLIWSKISTQPSQAYSISVDENTGNLYICGSDTDARARAIILAMDSDGNLLYCNKIRIPRP